MIQELLKSLTSNSLDTLLNIYIGIGAVLAGVIIFIAEAYTRDMEQGKILHKVGNIVYLIVFYFIGFILFIVEDNQMPISSCMPYLAYIKAFILFYIIVYSAYIVYKIYTMYDVLRHKVKYNKEVIDVFEETIRGFLSAIQKTYSANIVDTKSVNTTKEGTYHNIKSPTNGYIQAINMPAIKRINDSFELSDTRSIGKKVDKRTTLGRYKITDNTDKSAIEKQIQKAFTIQEDMNIESVLAEIDMIYRIFRDAIDKHGSDVMQLSIIKYRKLITLIKQYTLPQQIYNNFISTIVTKFINIIVGGIKTNNIPLITEGITIAKELYISFLEEKEYEYLNYNIHNYAINKPLKKALELLEGGREDDAEDIFNSIQDYIYILEDHLSLALEENTEHTDKTIEAFKSLIFYNIHAQDMILEALSKSNNTTLLMRWYGHYKWIVQGKYKSNNTVKEYRDMMLFFHNGSLLQYYRDDVRDDYSNTMQRYITEFNGDINTFMKYAIEYFSTEARDLRDENIASSSTKHNKQHHKCFYHMRYFIAVAIYKAPYKSDNIAIPDDILKEYIEKKIDNKKYNKEQIQEIIGFAMLFLKEPQEEPYIIKAISYTDGQNWYGAYNPIRENYTIDDMKRDIDIVHKVKSDIEWINPKKALLQSYLETVSNYINKEVEINNVQ